MRYFSLDEIHGSISVLSLVVGLGLIVKCTVAPKEETSYFKNRAKLKGIIEEVVSSRNWSECRILDYNGGNDSTSEYSYESKKDVFVGCYFNSLGEMDIIGKPDTIFKYRHLNDNLMVVGPNLVKVIMEN